MPELRLLSSIHEIAPAQWDACFIDMVETHACLAAIEDADISGFRWHYAVVEEEGGIVAAAAAFVTHYPLETMMEGSSRRLTAALRRLFPSLLAPRLACLGSPCTETAPFGFAAGLDAATREKAAHTLLEGFRHLATAEHCTLLAVKDLPNAGAALLDSSLRQTGYRPVAGQPVAWLPIDFASITDYLARLSRSTRRDLRRKSRSLSAIRIERRVDIADVVDRIYALYLETYARAEHRFEKLTPRYFTGLLRGMPGQAACMLYYAGDELLAANLLIETHDTLLDKYWCMAAAGRGYNLYHLSWLTNVQLCLERGLKRYQAGQANAELKRSLGCLFDPTVTYVRHWTRLGNRALRMVLPLLGAAPVDAAAA